MAPTPLDVFSALVTAYDLVDRHLPVLAAFAAAAAIGLAVRSLRRAGRYVDEAVAEQQIIAHARKETP